MCLLIQFKKARTFGALMRLEPPRAVQLSGQSIVTRPSCIYPDLPARLPNSWPLTKLDKATFYADDAHGFINQPPYAAAKAGTA
ncbi:hypothetical protein SAMN05518849_107197 [Sphingobium sp. AP50]|uniref:hypothetical protein n=1 Tax=Sphingobium sp. AP50 TaxID=1884369 RepID=UPI0008C343C6|nr:hypothetical protein [Sphingobium sp. AP50]SEJ50064.1 hypothetical protein SAMN05518849_107197 [Sphingobium sp. AP50]